MNRRTLLAELLRGIHVHGLAVDAADPDRLLIATHHGLHALTISAGRTPSAGATRSC